MDYLYKHFFIEYGGNDFLRFVGSDFLDLSLSAMRTSYERKKHNVLHHLSKCFEKTCESNESRMPMDRMPYGLLDYNLHFFSAK